MDFKRVNNVTEFTFSPDEVLGALFPKDKDLTLTPDSCQPLTIKVSGISEEEYKQMEWRKEFGEYVNTGEKELTVSDISKEALHALRSIGAYTVKDAVTINSIPKIMKGPNFTVEVICEIKLFAKLWNDGVTELINRREAGFI